MNCLPTLSLENKLFVRAAKCPFYAPSVHFLGFVIQQGQIKADPDKVRAVAAWPKPETQKQLCFLGFAHFYRRFIRDYSRKAAPLNQLTSTIPFKWSPEAESAFNILKELFISASYSLTQVTSRQYVEVDASDYGVGAVQSQWSPMDQKLHSSTFFSRRFSHAAEKTMTLVTLGCGPGAPRMGSLAGRSGAPLYCLDQP